MSLFCPAETAGSIPCRDPRPLEMALGGGPDQVTKGHTVKRGTGYIESHLGSILRCRGQADSETQLPSSGCSGANVLDKRGKHDPVAPRGT
jgi:hypothetical protein